MESKFSKVDLSEYAEKDMLSGLQTWITPKLLSFSVTTFFVNIKYLHVYDNN